jgi:hypothetical protein
MTFTATILAGYLACVAYLAWEFWTAPEWEDGE